MEKLLRGVERYYSEKIQQHGSTPAGVDWNSAESQRMRFDQLAKIIPTDNSGSFSILDFGCGYGALYNFLKEHFPSFQYSGFDISEPMIAAAAQQMHDEPVKFYSDLRSVERHDYVMASGIFNVKQSNADTQWYAYVQQALSQIDALSAKGFAFNMLTSYSDEAFKKDYLYYSNPSRMFEHCKTTFSKEVALLHDYKLYEFTILVRK